MSDEKKTPPAAPPPTGGVGSAYAANSEAVGKPVPLGSIGETITPPDEQSGKPEPETDKDELVAQVEATMEEAVQEGSPEKDEKETDAFANPFATDEEKEYIESQLTEINFEELIFEGFIEQVVPIREKLKVTFRTASVSSLTSVEREVLSMDGPNKYVFDMLSLYQLALHVQAINGKELPSYETENGIFDFDKFEARVARILRLPDTIVNMLMINGTWFQARVAEACKLEKLKN